MTNNCPIKAARHLAEMFSRCIKDRFFGAMNRHLKKTPQIYLRSVSKTLLRHLTKLFLRQVSHTIFCYFSESRFCLSIWWLILFYLQKGKFQGLHESQRKAYFWVFRVLGKASYEIQGFKGPIDSFQGFQGPLDTLDLQL